MVIKQTAGDSASGSDTGQSSISGANLIRLGSGTPVAVSHNASTAASGGTNPEPTINTYDVTLYASTIAVADVLSMSFLCTLAALNANAGTPIVFVKLVGALSASGAGYDIVIPLTPGQIWTWVNPANTLNVQPHATKDPNGNTLTVGANQKIATPQPLVTGPILKISCTPDAVSDVTIIGTIELLV